MVMNETAQEEETVLCALGRRWVLPPRTRFVLAPLEGWSQALLGEERCTKGYRVITLDPPWSNKSAQRLSGHKHYATNSWSQLPSLPIQRLASPFGTLLAVWVTNKQRYWTWLVETVFKAWGAEYITTWYWLKVTDSGDPVLPIDAARERKPFEPLVIGRVYRGSASGQRSRLPTPSHARTSATSPPGAAAPCQASSVQSVRCAEAGVPPTYARRSPQSSCLDDVAEAPTATTGTATTGETLRPAAATGSAFVQLGPIPMQRVLVSVPMRHSMKPPIDWHLDQCFSRRAATETGGCPKTADTAVTGDSVLGPEPEARLELFARGLRPGWTCVGNEVLAQQQICDGHGLYCSNIAGINHH